MKRNFLLLAAAMVLLAASATLTACGNDGVITPDKMPSKANSFIETYFPDCKVVEVEFDLDVDDFYKERDYDVELDCNVELEFSEKGEWMSVDCEYTAVPEAIIPAPILEYVKANYPNVDITSIEKERNGYEVGLVNDLDLDFDINGAFLRIDR